MSSGRKEEGDGGDWDQKIDKALAQIQHLGPTRLRGMLGASDVTPSLAAFISFHYFFFESA